MEDSAGDIRDSECHRGNNDIVRCPPLTATKFAPS
ncbi:MAG: hypothetical protein JWR37_1567 [Mycobacterium sp.]|nr:hypothetical protein [Mycobacterium sp.]